MTESKLRDGDNGAFMSGDAEFVKLIDLLTDNEGAKATAQPDDEDRGSSTADGPASDKSGEKAQASDKQPHEKQDRDTNTAADKADDDSTSASSEGDEPEGDTPDGKDGEDDQKPNRKQRNKDSRIEEFLAMRREDRAAIEALKKQNEELLAKFQKQPDQKPTAPADTEPAKSVWQNQTDTDLQKAYEYYTVGEGTEHEKAKYIADRIHEELIDRKVSRKLQERDQQEQEQRARAARDQYLGHAVATFEELKDEKSQFTKDAAAAVRLFGQLPEAPLLAAILADGMRNYRAALEKAKQGGNGKSAAAGKNGGNGRQVPPRVPASVDGAGGPAGKAGAEPPTSRFNEFKDKFAKSGGRDNVALQRALEEALKS